MVSLDLAPPAAPAKPVFELSEKPSLIGLSREELAAALVEKGVAERQVKMRVSQIWHWLYIRGISDFDDMTNVAKDLRALLKQHFTIQRPEIAEEQISKRRHPQVAAALPGAWRRPSVGGGDGLYSGRGPRHALHILPGRLHAHLLLLPHRHAAPRAQPDGGRNPLTASARPRSPW